MLDVNESFNYNSHIVPAGQYHGNYDIDTHNRLAGFQFGGDIMYQHCNWRIGGRAKIGPYINTAGQTTRRVIVDDFAASNPADWNYYGRQATLAFVSDTSIMAAYQLRPNMAVRASWDVLIMNEMALATDQIAFTQPVSGSVIHTAYLIYQGVSVGFEAVW